MHEVSVALGSRSYTIRIGAGLLADTGSQIGELRGDVSCAIVTDTNVDALHGDKLRNSLSASGIRHVTLTVAPGESTKSLEVLGKLVGQILDAKLERGDLVIAFGGGVVGDLAGFAAAITRRGMDFVQIPTTLLAQVDSSVGGKTGVNAAQGKNLIGAFHQPILVLADTEVLKTLPEREMKAGYAEMVKYGLIDRPDFFVWLEEKRTDVFGFAPALANAIATSCASKAEIVAADEREAGRRALLNLGHTFGHALEAATGYDARRLVHGEGVSIGLALAHEFSNRLNLCDADSSLRVRTHLAEAGLPVEIRQIPGELPSAAELAAYISQDKKVSRGRLAFILTKGIGRAYIEPDVPREAVLAFLEDKLRA
jgi:3-dehydroquinate synthase